MGQSATKISFFVFLLLCISCKKHDYCDDPPKTESCDLMQSLAYIPGTPDPETGTGGSATYSQYRKEYGADGKVVKLVAALYTLGLYDSVALLLRYSGNTVYLIDEVHPEDTVLIALFDAQHRLQKMKGDPQYTRHPILSTEFFYDANRLSGYLIDNVFDYHLTYDANGNVTRIYGEADGTDRGSFFTYDLTVTANQQFYSENFSADGVSNSVYLAQFLGWLPDLNPVNKRTMYKEVSDEVPTLAESLYVSEHTLTGHVYDSNGNLLSYKDGDYVYTNIYNCAAKTSAAPN